MFILCSTLCSILILDMKKPPKFGGFSAGDERIELPLRVLETPVIPFDQSPIFYFRYKETHLFRCFFWVPSKPHISPRFCHPAFSYPPFLGYALDLLVTVSSTCYHASTSALSTSSSSRGLTSLTNGISLLEGGFTLRCLQRFSLPSLATRPCI